MTPGALPEYPEGYVFQTKTEADAYWAARKAELLARLVAAEAEVASLKELLDQKVFR